jgi:uncharacterized membrane protein (UPF0127 family)
MKYLAVRNTTRNTSLGQKVRVATSLVDRAIGLLLTPSLGPEEGLWISPCSSVHTFFMRYPIDVLFLDSKGTIISRQTLSPWRVSKWHPKSRGVLEFNTGVVDRTKTEIGDHIDLQELN